MRTVETKKPFEVQVLKLEKWQDRPLKNNFFEVVYIAYGAGRQCINYNEYDYRKGSVFLLPPLRCHSYQIVEPTEFVFVKFTQAFFRTGQDPGYEEWFREASYVLANYTQHPGEVAPDASDRATLIHLVEAIRHEVHNQPGEALELIRSFMVSVLLLLMRSVRRSQHPRANNPTADARLDELITYIQDHLSDSHALQVASLAQRFHLSPTYFGEYFRKNTGLSLRAYIAHSRLKLAEIRLLYSDFTLAQIADELGFTDASHLSRTFKRYSGKTVGAFRRGGEYCLLKAKP